ncbi:MULTISPECIES: hypothetical protein [unclassified Beijerinckia]|uniref:hypothetical protein n=1 Tax=unclassified Beijerinckia TaxID=2638183 RepID=UPI0008970B30|nr:MULTISPECIES: hypothetical protein [unclassified Beijerinckia]MDH7797499.1 hypothetical protein [Beijerinckia sp. GAS462]SEC88037.1 hypothetical protein SAMN05443249_3793 [Beijerinckia sp. 28-YEA-48]
MKELIAIGAMALMGTVAHAQYRSNGGGFGSPGSHYVQPHTNSNGSQTQGHYQTNPNNTQRDNWSSQGNTNPYTGQRGTRVPRY